MPKKVWSKEMEQFLKENARMKAPKLAQEIYKNYGVTLTEQAINNKKKLLGLRNNNEIFCEGVKNPSVCYNCKYNDCIANDTNMSVIPITEYAEFFKICKELGV